MRRHRSFTSAPASVAVPGLVAGLAEAHARHGRLSWAMLFEPALELARAGVEMSGPQRFLLEILVPILERTEEGRGIYGSHTRAETAAMVPGLERLRDHGAAAVAELMPGHAADIAAYRVIERTPIEATFEGMRVVTCPAPSKGGAVVAEGLGAIAARDRATTDTLAVTLVEALLAGYGGTSRLAPLTGTTHVSVIDGDGSAAALSSTLGSGSGVFAEGFQLNNMLGELDVIGTEDRHPGDRLPSMMTPTLVLDGDAPRLVVGSAGSVRLAGAILQTIYHVVAGGGSVSDAIDHARLHIEDGVVQIEGGWPEDAAERLHQAGYQVNEWAGRNLYFGGVSAVERLPGRRAGCCGRSTAWRSWDRRPVITIRRAEPGDAQALVELAGEVGGEEGAWLLTSAEWRSITEERRYLRAVRRHPTPPSTWPRTGTASSAGSRSPVTSIRRARTSPTSA